MFTKPAIEKLKQLLPPEGTYWGGRRNGKELEFAIRVAIDSMEKDIAQRPKEIDRDYANFTCGNCDFVVGYTNDEKEHK